MLLWHRGKEEDSLVTHLSVVLKNLLLFIDDVVVLLLCFLNSIYTTLPCLVALSCGCTAKQGCRTWKWLHVVQMQSWTCTRKDGAGVICHCNCMGSLA